MSRPPKHVYNPHSRRILCQRCHRSPAHFSILTHIRLCARCKERTFPRLTFAIAIRHPKEQFELLFPTLVGRGE